MKTLEYRISDFIIGRTIDASEIVLNDEEYNKLSDKIVCIMKEIEAYLPIDKKHLIGDLESYNSTQVGMLETEIYKQGFKDGFKFIDNMNTN